MTTDARHSKMSPTNGGVHLSYSYSYANAAARTGASGFVADDVGKFARQTDNNTLWMLTATTPTWVQVGGALGDYLLRDGTLPMTGDLDCNDNKITDIEQLEIGNTLSPSYFIRFYIEDPSGSAVMSRGVSGFLKFMPDANYPQFHMGSDSSTGYCTVDAEGDMTLYLNVFDDGDVRVNNLLGPVEGEDIPLGDSTDWWSEGYIKDVRRVITGVKTAGYTANAGEVVRVDTSGGLVAITLPLAASYSGAKITLKKTTTDSNTMRAARSGSDTIEGATQVDHNSSREYATYISDGVSDWMRVA